MNMFYRLVLLTVLLSSFSVNCLLPIPKIYRKAELALKRYLNHPSHDSIVHSLLNILLHDKKARAFTSEKAIQLSLESIKEFDRTTNTNYEKILRQAIYDVNCKRNRYNCVPSFLPTNTRPAPSADLKQRIVSALDQFFAGKKNANDDDDLQANISGEKQ